MQRFVVIIQKGEVYLEKREIPVWEKYALTINEASEYFNIGGADKKLDCDA